MKRTSGTPEVSGAESVRKVLRLFLSFTPESPLLTVGELAKNLNLPRSSVYRYVALLRELGLLEETVDGLHRVTMRVLPLARAALSGASSDPVKLARQVLERMTAETGETTLLMQRIAHHVMAVDIVESAHTVRLAFERGKPMTLHLGSGGRVLMSTLSNQERSAYRDEWRRGGASSRLIPTNRQLDQIAADGWTESFGQVEEGIWGVAAAVTDRTGVVAALGLAGPEQRTVPRREHLISTVREGAAHLSRLLTEADDFR